MKKVVIDDYATEYDDKIKSEARKEFVKKIKEKKMQSTMDIHICTIEMIDNLLKEMESENNG